MPDQIRKCEACGFENHGSCRFCIQCGKELGSTTPAPETEEPEPHESPEVPEESTEQMLRRVAEESEFEHEQVRAGWKVTVPMGGERKQKVYVVFNGHDDDGNDIISFLSVCGEVDQRRAINLLRFNARQAYGTYAAKTIQGKEYFVVTANQLAQTADPSEVQNLLVGVARAADRVENQLSEGKDLF